MGPSLLLGFSGEQNTTKEQSEFTNRFIIDNNDYRKILPSFGVEWWIVWRVDKKWSIESGVRYIYAQHYLQTEQIVTGSLNSYQLTERKLLAKQLHLPIQLRYNFIETGKIKPYFALGGNTAYSLSLKQKTTDLFVFNGQVNISKTEEKIDFDAVFPYSFDRLEFNWIYSLGIEFNHFSIALNRTKAIVMEAIEDQNFIIDCFVPCPTFDARKMNTTMLSIKYKL